MINQDMPLKCCTKCKQWYPATSDFFYKHPDQKSGFRPDCKNCKRTGVKNNYAEHSDEYCKQKRDYYVTNKEQIDAKNKEWRDANPDYMREYNVQYRNKHLEELRIYAKEYRDKHKEEWREYHRKYGPRWRTNNRSRVCQYSLNWQKRNRRKVAINSSNRRANKRNAGGFYDITDVRCQYDIQEGKCYWCNEEVGTKYHVDHVIPLSRGGTNWPSNIVVACARCNLSKGDKMPWEWTGNKRQNSIHD